MLGTNSYPRAFSSSKEQHSSINLSGTDFLPSLKLRHDRKRDVPEIFDVKPSPCIDTPATAALASSFSHEPLPGLAPRSELSLSLQSNADLPTASRDFRFPASPGNRDIFSSPSSSVSEGSTSLIVSDTLSKIDHSKVQMTSLGGSTHREFILAPHDIDVLRHIEEESGRPKSEGTLQILLAKRSDLNIGCRIREISPVQRSLGGYSDIFTGTYVLTNDSHCKVAIKKMRVHIMDDQNFQKKLARELYVWSKLTHSRILPLEGFFIEDNKYPSLVSKWMENGTVLQYLRSNPTVDTLQLLIGIAEGLDYLHKCNVVHSDIKPDNVLISDSGEPLLCDFGVARMLLASETFHFSSSLTGGLRGTIRYLSRELLVESSQGLTSYSFESDVWAFGMTSIAILQRQPPYHRLKMDVQVILAISNGELPRQSSDFSFWPLQNQIIWRICERCWKPPPRRPPMRYILYELSRLKLVNPVRTEQDAWLKYRFFWLDNDNFHKASARSFLVTPIRRLTHRYSPYNTGNRASTSHDLFPI